MYQNLKFVIFGTLCKEMQQSKIKDGTLLASSWRIPPSAPGGFFSICSRCCSDTLGIWGHHSPLALAVPPYPHTGSSTVHPIKSCASTQLATGTSQTVTCLRQLLTTAVHARGHPSQHKASLICHCQPAYRPNQATLTSSAPSPSAGIACSAKSHLFLSAHMHSGGVSAPGTPSPPSPQEGRRAALAARAVPHLPVTSSLHLWGPAVGLCACC